MYNKISSILHWRAEDASHCSRSLASCPLPPAAEQLPVLMTGHPTPSPLSLLSTQPRQCLAHIRRGTHWHGRLSTLSTSSSITTAQWTPDHTGTNSTCMAADQSPLVDNLIGIQVTWGIAAAKS